MICIEGIFVVCKIFSCNGFFVVVDFVIDVVEFKVKDMLFDQFEVGEYCGIFYIVEIYFVGYQSFGCSVIELWVWLYDLCINFQCVIEFGVGNGDEIDFIDEVWFVKVCVMYFKFMVLFKGKLGKEVFVVKFKIVLWFLGEVKDVVVQVVDFELFGVDIYVLVVFGQLLKLDFNIDDCVCF